MAKILLSLSVLFLTLSAVFGVLNTSKTRNLRELSDRTALERTQTEQMRVVKEKELQAREAAAAAATAKAAETEAKVADAEADLIKTQQERADLQATLQQNQNEIESLRRELEQASTRELMPESLPMPGSGELQTQLEETRRQLDNAERENQLLSEKIRTVDRGTVSAEQPRRRVAAPRNAGLRGSVLAVNTAYNFVVLNLGGRQGLDPNSEMLVLRGGTPIGKIRVSSVEPATAIGDIVTNSLARGVQVQPGDTVIYAATN